MNFVYEASCCLDLVQKMLAVQQRYRRARTETSGQAEQRKMNQNTK